MLMTVQKQFQIKLEVKREGELSASAGLLRKKQKLSIIYFLIRKEIIDNLRGCLQILRFVKNCAFLAFLAPNLLDVLQHIFVNLS